MLRATSLRASLGHSFVRRRSVRLLATRTESDAFGPIEVDSAVLWGAQTQRSLQNFPIGGPESKMPLQVRRCCRCRRARASQPASSAASLPLLLRF